PKSPQILPTVGNIEIVAFPDVQLLDVTGPLQVFESANAWARELGKTPPYTTRVVSSASPVRSWAGLSLVSHALSRSDRPIDTLIVAGGSGVRGAIADAHLVRWIAARARQARRVASVCSGALLLAACGLLAGRRAATHWRACAVLAARHPDVRVESD